MYLPKQTDKTIFFFCICVFLVSCGVRPPLIEWTYQKDGVILVYRADDLLNIYDNKPHTVIMAVYQLTGLDAFKSLLTDDDGMRKLLRAERFDPSVISANKFIVQPGEQNKILFDRFGNSKWIAVVAGYYHMKSGSMSQIYEIPVRIEEKGIIRKKKIAHIDQINVSILLGQDSLQLIQN